ncbi:MAG: helix-turn-helix domain-containing protein [Eubacteriales bacterium]|nr:helix-turn-helix domain-containing protein [Eubacteriales bacterium]
MFPKNIAEIITDTYKEQQMINFALFNKEGVELSRTKSIQNIDLDKINQIKDDLSLSFIEEKKAYFVITNLFKASLIVYLEANDGNIEEIKNSFILTLNCCFRVSTDKLDKEEFIKNILLGNIYGLEIDHNARKLFIPNFRNRVVFYIHIEEEYDIVLIEKFLKKTYNIDNNGSFILQIEENVLAFVYEDINDSIESEKIANDLSEILKKEFKIGIKISYGTICNNLRSLFKVYKESKISYEIGITFYKEVDIYSYNNLGLGRLIFQMPVELCKMFVDEAFKNNSNFVIDTNLEEEIKTFFENNLNISETSRAMNIHRNTLVYRFDKLKNETGLDIRNFYDANLFYISIMIMKYARRKGENTFND